MVVNSKKPLTVADYPGLDKATLANIRHVMYLVRNHDWDWLTVVDGGERTGKSTLSMHRYIVSGNYMRRVECEEYDTVLAGIAFSFDDLLNTIRTLKNGSPYIYDEASVLGREAMREHNLRMIRVMSVIGERNLSGDWTFPSFWMLDPYLREGRVKTRAYVYCKRGERGYVSWYVSKRYPWPRSDGSTVWWSLAYQSRFASVQSVGPCYKELWAKYEEKAHVHKESIYAGGKRADPRREIALRLRSKGMSIREIAPVVNVAVGTLGQWLRGIEAGDESADKARRSRR